MDSESQWLLLGGACVLLALTWVGAGKPNGTDILLSMLSPLELIDRIAFRIGAVADDEKQPGWKRGVARLVRYVGLKLLLIGAIAVVVFVVYGRAIRRAFGWF